MHMDKKVFENIQKSVSASLATWQKHQDQMDQVRNHPDISSIEDAINSKKEKDRQSHAQEMEEQRKTEHKFQTRLTVIGWIISFIMTALGMITMCT